jgi:hypothetical protein
MSDSQQSAMHHGARVADDGRRDAVILLVADLREQARSRITTQRILSHHNRAIARAVPPPRFSCAQPEDMLEWRAADEIERLRQLLDADAPRADAPRS